MAAMGVSRTVVREAVAALRAEGLVTTRQGSGAFVAADASRVPFRIDPDGLSSIADVLEVMELRLAIEVEAAALAAERITPERLSPIAPGACAPSRPPFSAARAPSTRTSPSIAPIAEATGNPRFAELLEYLGRHVIPRQSIRVSVSTPQEQRQYLVRIQKEHAPHPRGDPGRSFRGGAQGHAHAPDAQPAALSPAGRAPVAGRLIGGA